MDEWTKRKYKINKFPPTLWGNITLIHTLCTIASFQIEVDKDCQLHQSAALQCNIKPHNFVLEIDFGNGHGLQEVLPLIRGMSKVLHGQYLPSGIETRLAQRPRLNLQGLNSHLAIVR